MLSRWLSHDPYPLLIPLIYLFCFLLFQVILIYFASRACFDWSFFLKFKVFSTKQVMMAGHACTWCIPFRLKLLSFSLQLSWVSLNFLFNKIKLNCIYKYPLSWSFSNFVCCYIYTRIRWLDSNPTSCTLARQLYY